jgi:hypothetical protein
MNETPTPRTDAEEKLFFSSISGLPDPSRNYVSINFARQLERELAEAKQHEEDWRGVGILITERDSLREELAAANNEVSVRNDENIGLTGQLAELREELRLLKINTLTMIEDSEETKQENERLWQMAEQLALALEQRVIPTGPCMFRYAEEHKQALATYERMRDQTK